MPRVWADTLLHAEQIHLVGVLSWAGASIIAGTALWAGVVVRRSASPLLRQFSLQMLGWGVVEAAVAGLCWRGVALRDVGGAARLERALWLTVGLEIGLVLVGATLALTAWVIGRRLAAVGAGIGVSIQALGLLVLDLQLVSVASR